MNAARLFGSIGALIVTALVGGTLISSAAAESPTPTANAEPGPYCQSFRSHLADALGTDAAGLESAFRSAAGTTIDEAVAAGDVSAARAEALKSRLGDANLDTCLGLGRHLVRRTHPAARADLRSAAADALGMQPSELAAALRSGDSLKDVAKAQGVDYAAVESAVMDAAKADLDKAVEAGRITGDREQAVLDRLQEALDSGKWPRQRRGGRPAAMSEPGA